MFGTPPHVSSLLRDKRRRRFTAPVAVDVIAAVALHDPSILGLPADDGRIRHPGRFVMLLPRELDMIDAGRHMPLPVPKPKIPELEVHKHDQGKVAFAKSNENKREAIKRGQPASPTRLQPQRASAPAIVTKHNKYFQGARARYSG
jgi:hypothetical protein